jgi:hypothetical protein
LAVISTLPRVSPAWRFSAATLCHLGAAPLVEGDSFELTLEFEAAGSMTLEVPVKSIAAESADDGHGHGHGEH